MGRVAARAAVAVLLVAAVVVPLLANPHSARAFGDRTVVLRLLGTAALIAALLHPVGIRRLGLPFLGALLYLAVSLFAALLSAVPATAMPGDYLRQGGFLTDLGLFGVFLAGAAVAARPGAPRLLADVLLLGGASTALLAVAQSLGLPVPWAEPDATSRAASFTGGPTYLGSHLAVLLPLAAARARGRIGFATLAVILVGLILSASRIALVAAVLGVAVVLLSQSLARRRFLALAVLGLLALLALACLTPIRDFLPPDSLPNRIASEYLGRQVEVRSLLYRDAAAAIASEPEHLLLGRGPDTIGHLFTSQISEELQRSLGGDRRVDRLHCDPLDLLYTRGLLAPLAIVLLLAGALGAARAIARSRPAGSDPALALGLAGSLVANYADSLLSVPGPVSRLLLFGIAGWLAGMRAGAAAADDEPGPAVRGLLCGAACATTLFSLGALVHTWVAVPFLALLPARKTARAVLFAACVFLPFLGLHLTLDPAGAATHAVYGSQVAAERARLETLLLLGLVLAAATAVTWRLARPERAPPGRTPAVKLVGAVLAGLILCRLAFDDSLRLLADVNARSANVVQLAGGEPREAVRLLERATGWAPEVSTYRGRFASALVDEAIRGKDRTPAELLTELAYQLGWGLERHARDAYLVALGAGCILEFARLLPEQNQGLSDRALKLAEDAARRAPHSTPILQVLAEVRIHVGDVAGAIEVLEHALTVDANQQRTLLLRGRAAAADLDLAGAIRFYGRVSNRQGSSSNEALAALALEMAARGNNSDAATLVLGLVESAASSPRFEQDVHGARPLLRFVPGNRFVELFETARARYHGNPADLDRVEAALAY